MEAKSQGGESGIFENSDRLVSVREAADLTGLSVRTIRYYVQIGKLTARKTGNAQQARLRIYVKDIERILELAYPNREMPKAKTRS